MATPIRPNSRSREPAARYDRKPSSIAALFRNDAPDGEVARLGGNLGGMLILVKSIDWIMDICMVNIRTFDLNLLRALRVLLDEPQVSSAARRLNLSQPATSAALARLRTALGDPLLERAGNQMVRTALGEELRPKLRRLLADIEQTLSAPAAFNPASSERTFRIAANDYSVAGILSSLLERMQRL